VILTRRRLAAVAAAFWPWWRLHPAVAADLPDCTMLQDFDDWSLRAWYGEKAADAAYSLKLRQGTIPLPNRGDSLKLTIFELDYDPTAGSFGVSCDTQWPDGAKAPDPASYQLVNLGAALVTFNLSPDHESQSAQIGAATADRMIRNDTIVQVAFGDQKYQVTVQAQNLRLALVTAQALAKRVKAEHDRQACKELESRGGCVLTTVSCHAVGLPDDCFELRTMRRLRDRWIVAQPFGDAALRWYYAISPQILGALPSASHARVFRRFYALRVVPAVVAERLGLHACAYRWLKSGVEKLAGLVS